MLVLSLFLFDALCAGKNPIILVPGLLGSVLKGNISERTRWYCPKLNNEVAWLKLTYGVYPLYNCLLDTFTLNYNQKTGLPEQLPNINLDVVDFGGVEGVTYIDQTFFDIHVAPYYKVIIERLKGLGYEVKKNLFGCPFDWRFGLLQPKEYWNKVKDLIEKAYELNGQKKVVLIGHSMGCFFINYFCMNISTPEWRHKYIENVILAAPSFGGSGLAYNSMFYQELPYLGFIGKFPATAGSLGGLQIHVPNFEIYGDTTLYIDEKGVKYPARELVNVLIKEGKLTGDQIKMMELHKPFYERAPPEFDLPTAILYNSGLINQLGIDRSNGEGVIYGRGDIAVNAEGPEYACKHWKATCHDLIRSSPFSNHITLMYEEGPLKWIIDHATNSSWY